MLQVQLIVDLGDRIRLERAVRPELRQDSGARERTRSPSITPSITTWATCTPRGPNSRANVWLTERSPAFAAANVAGIDYLFAWTSSSSFGNFLSDLDPSQRTRVRERLARTLEARRTPAGIRLERYLVFCDRAQTVTQGSLCCPGGRRLAGADAVTERDEPDGRSDHTLTT